MEWYLEVLKKYADFSGRARRKEYWTFMLANFILGLAVSSLSIIPIVGAILATAYGLYSLGVLIPSIAVGVRRLHDTGRSGWWYILSVIATIGFALMSVLLTIILFGAFLSMFGINTTANIASIGTLLVWLFWVALVTAVCFIWITVFLVQKGTAGSNKYGDDPKETDIVSYKGDVLNEDRN